jgi:hypothetical protein
VLNDLDELAPRLIDVHMKGAQLWPSGLHEKLNALFDTVDGADYAPPVQTREVFGELNAELQEVIGWLRNLNAEGVAELRRAIEATGLPIVGIDA